MDGWRIAEAGKKIAERTLALEWLQKYGVNLVGRADSDAAAVRVDLNYGSACTGAKEAASVLSSYAKVNLPKIVQDAIECCRNDIQIYSDVIRSELDKPTAPVTPDKGA